MVTVLVVRIKRRELDHRGPCILLSLSGLEPIPQLLRQRNGNPCTAILRHVWNRQHCPLAHALCDHSDNLVLSQAHGLLAGVTAAGQAESETAQSQTVLCVRGQPPQQQ